MKKVVAMTVKLGDIAKKAGVSLTTASRIINGDKNMSVSKETEDRIWKFVHELGYETAKIKSPSKSNKRKGTSKTKNIGLILTETKEMFEDTFFSKIIHGIEQELIIQRHNLYFAYTAYDLEDPIILSNVLNSGCDGIIFIGSLPINLYNQLTSRISNCVSIFDVPDENPIECITIDYEKNAYMVVKKMIEFGHRNIAFIGGPTYFKSIEEISDDYSYSYEGRFRGYCKALLESGIKKNHNIIKDGNWDIEVAYKKMGEILDSNEKVSAVFAAGDRIALGAMRAIQEKGKNIPDDISVAGFDDIEIAKYLNPPLTTVNYPKEEMGRLAVKVLVEKINMDKRSDNLIKTILLPSKVVERGSIRNLKG